MKLAFALAALALAGCASQPQQMADGVPVCRHNSTGVCCAIPVTDSTGVRCVAWQIGPTAVQRAKVEGGYKP